MLRTGSRIDRTKGLIMHDYHTTWLPFLMIVGGYVAASLYVLGAKKVFFEPYVEKDDEKK